MYPFCSILHFIRLARDLNWLILNNDWTVGMQVCAINIILTFFFTNIVG